MAKAAKPEAQSAEPEATGAPPKKSKKKLILIVVAGVLLLGGGAAAFLLLGTGPVQQHGGGSVQKQGKDAPEEEARSKSPAKFVDLGQFTANLMHENSDRFLQASISLKITKPELEDRIKETKPEILHRVNMLLQSKYPSELSTLEGKERLAQQIKGQVEYVVGIRKIAPPISVGPAAAPEANIGKSSISDVLFTSFIIQ